MKVVAASLATVAVGFSGAGHCPLHKILQTLGDLKARIKGEGEVEAAQFDEYEKWCAAENRDKKHAIETGKDQAGDLSAEIEELTASIGELQANVVELTGAIQKNEADLSSATSLREKEHADFVATEKELTDAIDQLARAASVLRKAGLGAIQLRAALAQVASGLDVVMSAASIDIQDRRKLSALLEASTEEDDDAPTGAPQAAAYESHSASILDTLAELKVKAEGERSEARKEESNRKHAYEMLRQSLSDQISTQNRDMKNDQGLVSKKQEAKGTAEGNLEETSSTLSSDKTYLNDLVQMCTMKSEEWDARQKGRAEELATLTKAVEFISSDSFKDAVGRRIAKMGGDGDQFKKDVTKLASFMQLTTTVTSKMQNDNVRERVAELLQATASRIHSVGLAQLAQRTRMGDGPFEKVKGLISDMIAKLTDQAAKETNHNAFCVSETADSTAKRDQLSARFDNLDTRVDAAQAEVAQLKEQIADLSAQVSEMDANMAEATALRQKENKEYKEFKYDMNIGVEAVTAAIATLQDYFNQKESFLQAPKFGGPVFEGGYEKKSDSANGIIALMENVLNEAIQLVSQTEATEQEAARAYAKMKQENEVNRAMKTTEAKTKEGEVARVTNLINDLKNDRSGTSEELDAVIAYLEKLKAKCEHKPMSFEERAARRQTEIDSLKQALDILENETATSFLQTLRK